MRLASGIAEELIDSARAGFVYPAACVGIETRVYPPSDGPGKLSVPRLVSSDPPHDDRDTDVDERERSPPRAT